MFYILTVILTLLHLQYMIWWFGEILNQWVFALVLMPVVKINMGFDQCWVMYELSLRVQENIQRCNSIESDQLNISKDSSIVLVEAKTERIIKKGRRLITAFIVLNLTAISSYLIWVEVTHDPEGRKKIATETYYIIAPSLMVLFFILLVNVIWLIK